MATLQGRQFRVRLRTELFRIVQHQRFRNVQRGTFSAPYKVPKEGKAHCTASLKNLPQYSRWAAKLSAQALQYQSELSGRITVPANTYPSRTGVSEPFRSATS
jgi:hypothetical protein